MLVPTVPPILIWPPKPLVIPNEPDGLTDGLYDIFEAQDEPEGFVKNKNLVPVGDELFIIILPENNELPALTFNAVFPLPSITTEPDMVSVPTNVLDPVVAYLPSMVVNLLFWPKSVAAILDDKALTSLDGAYPFKKSSLWILNVSLSPELFAISQEPNVLPV